MLCSGVVILTDVNWKCSKQQAATQSQHSYLDGGGSRDWILDQVGNRGFVRVSACLFRNWMPPLPEPGSYSGRSRAIKEKDPSENCSYAGSLAFLEHCIITRR